MGAIWSPRWRELSERRFDPKTMRSEMNIMKHIQTSYGNLPLWQRKCADAGVPFAWMEDSKFGMPQGSSIDGKFVTAHSCRMAYYAHRILSRIEWKKPITVVEIGGGFGSLARTFAANLGKELSAYFLVDSTEMRRISESYLAGAGHKTYPFWWLRPTDAWPECDLVINTNSLGEMDLAEVTQYFKKIQAHLIGGGAFYSHNRIERLTNFRAYPYDGQWEHHVEKDGIFVEALSIRRHGANSPHPVTMIH